MNQQTFGNAFKAEIRKNGSTVLQEEVKKAAILANTRPDFYSINYGNGDSAIIDE
jgi:hypothetical protein